MTTLSDNASTSTPSAFTTLLAMFTEPSKAFDTIARRSMVWLPLLFIISFSIALLVWYYQAVDISWLQDKLTAAVTDPSARDRARGFISRKVMTTTSVIGIVLIVPIVYAITAGYFLIVAKIKKFEFGFGKWFAFIAWASVPSLLAAPLGGIQILLANNGQLEPGQLNPVSLNSLFFHLAVGQRWASLLDSISLITVWTLVLSVIGFQQWTKSSRTNSIVTVSLPYVLIYGIWAVISLLSK